MIARALALVLLLSTLLSLAAACDGDDEDAAGSDTTQTVAVLLSQRVQLEEGASRLAEGAFSTALVPTAVSGFDPASLPLEGQREPPPCADFIFTFAWQVREATPAEGLVWRINEDGVVREIATGASGDATVGCGFIEAVNTGSERVTLDVHYLIGQRGQ